MRNKILYLVFFFATILIGLFFAFTINKKGGIASQQFSIKLQNLALLKGQPIEGFNAEILMEAFANLSPTDFDNVETLGGKYEYNKGELIHVRKKSRGNIQTISSAEKSINENGYSVLRKNIMKRVGGKNNDEIIKMLRFKPSNFKECEGAGYPVVETNLPRCLYNSDEFVK